MKHKLLNKLFTAVWAFLLSFSLSAAATMSVVTAFSLGIDTDLLLRTCARAAAICTLCYSLPLSLIPIGGGAAILGYLWQKGILESTAEAFLNRLSRQYDRAYGWGIIRWGYRTADQMEPYIVFVLCILGAVIALLTARETDAFIDARLRYLKMTDEDRAKAAAEKTAEAVCEKLFVYSKMVKEIQLTRGKINVGLFRKSNGSL